MELHYFTDLVICQLLRPSYLLHENVKTCRNFRNYHEIISFRHFNFHSFIKIFILWPDWLIDLTQRKRVSAAEMKPTPLKKLLMTLKWVLMTLKELVRVIWQINIANKQNWWCRSRLIWPTGTPSMEMFGKHSNFGETKTRGPTGKFKRE